MHITHNTHYMHHMPYTQMPESCHQLIQISHTAHMFSDRTVPTAVLFSMKPDRTVSNTSRLIRFMPRGLIRYHHGAAR